MGDCLEIKMAAEKFAGSWKSDTLVNFDEYMKAMGVNYVLRKAGSVSTTHIEIKQDGENWNWKYKIAFKSGELNFRLGEEFDEITPDGRPVKSIFTMEGEKLVQVQRGKPVDTTISRTVDEEGVMQEYCTARDITCHRTYKRPS